jgi:hypothetical protein
MLSLTNSHPDLGSESDSEVDTDTGPLPPAPPPVDELVELGSKADVQVESDTAPVEEKPEGWAETSTVDGEPASPWGLVPIEAGEEDSTQSPDSREVAAPARPTFLSRLFIIIAVVVAFALGIVLTRLLGVSGEGEHAVPGMVEPSSPTSETLDRFSSSITKAHQAAALAEEKRREETKRQNAEKEIEELKKKIFTAMRRKGIVFSDSQRLQTEYRKMKSMSERSELEDALSAGEQALKAIMRTRINKTFVSEKLKRLTREYDNVNDKAASRLKEDLKPDIITAIETGKYRHANRLLNRAIRTLESMND